MDERGRKGAVSGRVDTGGTRRKRPDRNAQRPGSSPGADRRPGRRSSRARRRRRNAIIRWLIFIILIIAVIGGFAIWRKYGPSNERADLNQYYELDAENDVAVVVNNEVVRSSEGAAEGEAAESSAPGRYMTDSIILNIRSFTSALIKGFTGIRMRISCCILCREAVFRWRLAAKNTQT